MASQFYNDFIDAEFGAPIHSVIDLNTDDIREILIDEGTDAFNPADQDLADITGGARVSVSANLTSKTVGVVGDGVFDHADETHTAVTGASIESITYYKHSGTESTSPLISNHDNWSNLPLTPNGGNIVVAPAAGGVFAVPPV
jgi:hypothetical protein